MIFLVIIKIRGISSDFRDCKFQNFPWSMSAESPREARVFGARWLALRASQLPQYKICSAVSVPRLFPSDFMFLPQNILSALKKVTKKRSSIFIAHRLSTVVDADEILVLEGGRVRERGSHLSLITDSNSLYAHLWHKQNMAHAQEVDKTRENSDVADATSST